MAQLIDLGKLRFNFMGSFSASTEYESNDVVRYGGNLYVYTYPTKTSGFVPSNYTYWTMLLEGLDWAGDWSSAVTYQANQIVKYGGKVYVASGQTLNEPPGDVYAEKWTQLVDGIQYEGPYDEEASYQVNDVITYGGISYICKLDSTGNLPTNTTYWEVFVGGIQYEGTYSGSTQYQKNDIVSFNGSTYIAKQDTTGNAPTNSTYWDLLAGGVIYAGEYNAETPYLSNNIVTFDGSSWISVQSTTGNEPGPSSEYWDVLAPGTFPSFDGNVGYFLSNDGTSVLWTEDLAASSLDISSAFYVGTGAKEFALDEDANSEPLTNPVATFRFASGTEDSSFAQLAFQNADPTSSTDIIAYMDNGSDSAGWMGMGITGSTFDDTTYGITAPGDGYLFLETAGNPGDYTGNMVFATGANGSENKLVFAAGGFDSGLTQMEITPGVNVHVEIPTPSTSPSTGAFTVVGGVGVQGDMNIQGDVNIVGQITFGGEGTSVTTNNLAVSDPLIFTGTNNLADTFDLGFIGEYAIPVGTSTPFDVNNKELTSNVAKLTTTVAHSILIGDVISVSGVDATFNGTYVVTGTPTATTITYDKTASNVASTAVSPTGTVTSTHHRRWAGSVRDASDGKIKFFSDASIKPTNSVDFAQSGLQYANIVINDITANGDITADELSSRVLNLSGTSTQLKVTNPTTSSYFLTDGNSFSLKNSSNNDIFSISSGGNLLTTGTLTSNGLATLSGGISTAAITASGNVTITGRLDVQEIREDVVDATISGNVLTANYDLSNIFYIPTAPAANFTVNLTNAPTDNGKTFTITVIVVQGATGYLPNTFQIGGVTPSGGTNGIRWVFGQTPVASSGVGKLDVFNFTLIRRASTWVVMGNASTNFPA